MQKEAYWLKKRCVTIRSETEWTETIKSGWNTLVFDNLGNIQSLLDDIPSERDPLIYGDGTAADKITQCLIDFYKGV